MDMADSTVSGTSDLLRSMGLSGTSGTVSGTEEQNLTMDDFFQLMVAQLQNQDMFNPTDNTEFISQMAQFSMVSALTDMQELTSVTYSLSLIGKQATVAFVTDTGELQSLTGVVEGVNLYNGAAEVVINGEAYGIANVMSVGTNTGASGESLLASNAGLIGMIAAVMRATDTGVETVRGVIEQLKLVDDELWAYIGGNAYRLSELAELSAASETADAS
jgi:flagellar basal-body rod modification protein FlgD